MKRRASKMLRTSPNASVAFVYDELRQDQRFDKKDIYNKERVLFWILKFDIMKITENKFDAFSIS